jgi:hypothetical protein
VDLVPRTGRARRKPPSRKGIPATEKQKKILAENAAKGPEAVRAKGRKARAAKAAGEPLRFDLLKSGELTVRDLDDEEIVRCQTRDRAGGFTFSHQQVMPDPLAIQIRRELFRRAQRAFDAGLIPSIAVLQKIMQDEEFRGSDRIRAAEVFQDRTLGRVSQHIAVHTDVEWGDTFEGVAMGYDTQEETE